MVFLKSGATLALDDENGCIHNLVELGQVEPPAPEGETLVPDSAQVGTVGQTLRVHQHIRVEARPGAVVWMVDNRVTKASGTVNLAQRINRGNHSIGLAVMRERDFEAADHGEKCDGRIDSQEQVVANDEDLKCARLRNGPGLVAMLAIVPIEECGGDKIYGRDGQWDFV